MPELPEVETVRRSLEPRILGKTIANVLIYYEPMIRPLARTHFKEVLIGETLAELRRKGKYLIFDFSSIVLLVHLRMEGKFFLGTVDTPKMPHEHVRYIFSDKSVLIYHDVRKFGTHTLKAPKHLTHTPPFTNLGFEPGDTRLTPTYLKNKLKTDRKIKTALLDQSIILGLGNIYVDEVLFCAKIRPTRRGRRLTKKDCENVIACSERVIDKAIALGGSSIRTYTNSLGISGRFQNELNVHMRAGQPCNSCGKPIEKIKVNGRGTYYCSSCQRS